MIRLWGAVIALWFCFTIFQERGHAEDFFNANKFLTRMDVEETSAYATYLKQRQQVFSEIYYLISLVEDSPYHFDKDGKKYSSDSAAGMLRYVLSKEQRKINSAESFIEKLSRYIDTGEEPCAVIYPDGSSTPATEVLYYELTRLREYERNHDVYASAGEGEHLEIVYYKTQ